MRLGHGADSLGLARATAIARRLGAEPVALDAAGAEATSTLRAALLAGEVDAVVHALPDPHLAPADGVALAAVPRRGDARDVLVTSRGGSLDALPAGARVGVGSARRRAQLLALRPDLEAADVGDAEDALARVGEADDALAAVIVAAADLGFLGRSDETTEHLSLTDWLTEPGQGALALETRRGEERAVKKLDHRPSRLAVQAERAVPALLGAGPDAGIGAHALLADGLFFLSARVSAPDGSRHLTSSHALYPEDVRDPAAELAKRVADELLDSGAAALLGRRP